MNFANYQKDNDKYSSGISSRIPSLDLARIIGMLMMIQGHVIDSLGQPSIINLEHFPWNFWYFFRGITAPIFLTVSGAVHLFANKRASITNGYSDNINFEGSLTTKTIKKRVITIFKLFFIGYFLNFPASSIYNLIYLDKQTWETFLQVNILQLLSVTLGILLIIYLFTKTDKLLSIITLTIALLITFATPFVQSQPWFLLVPEGLGSYFSLEHGSHFAIFPFTAYLFYGISLGVYLKKINSDLRLDFLIKKLPIFGLLVSIIGIPIFYLFCKYPYTFPDPNNANPGMVLIRIGIVFIIIGIVSYFYSKTKKYGHLYSFFGKKALFVYITHLILLFGLRDISSIGRIYYRNMDLGWVLVWVFIILASTLFFTYIIDFTIKKNIYFAKIYRIIVYLYILYILFY